MLNMNITDGHSLASSSSFIFFLAEISWLEIQNKDYLFYVTFKNLLVLHYFDIYQSLHSARLKMVIFTDL